MYKICIPSYHRADSITLKTLAMLNRHSIPKEKISIYIVEEDLEAYTKSCPGYRLVVGVKGLVPQRDFIYADCSEGDWIVMIDDDVQEILGMDRKPVKDLDTIILDGFQACVKEKCRLWGINPVSNPFMMRYTRTTHLLFCIGAFFGIIKTGVKPPMKPTLKEDYYRTCSYFKADGKVIRLNYCAPKTTYSKGSGGLNETRNYEMEQKGVSLVCEDFPDLATGYIRKKNGRPELKLKCRVRGDAHHSHPQYPGRIVPQDN